jgi:hypothetical protein
MRPREAILAATAGAEPLLDALAEVDRSAGLAYLTGLRLLHHASAVVTDGDSYRMRQARARGGTTLNKH